VKRMTPKRRASRRAFRAGVFVRDKWCRLCGALGTDQDHPHHILASGKGGGDEVENGARLCESCHWYVTHTVEGIKEGRERGLVRGLPWVGVAQTTRQGVE